MAAVSTACPGGGNKSEFCTASFRKSRKCFFILQLFKAFDQMNQYYVLPGLMLQLPDNASPPYKWHCRSWEREASDEAICKPSCRNPRPRSCSASPRAGGAGRRTPGRSQTRRLGWRCRAPRRRSAGASRPPWQVGWQRSSTPGDTKNVDSGWRWILLDEDDYYWVLVVSLEQRISAGRKKNGDEVVFENQHGGREVKHLEGTKSNLKLFPKRFKESELILRFPQIFYLKVSFTKYLLAEASSWPITSSRWWPT